MTALFSCCESSTCVTAGTGLSSFPKAGLIATYKFPLCGFTSGCISALGKPRRSAKRLANFSCPLIGSSDSSLVFAELYILAEPGEARDVSKMFFTAELYSQAGLGLHVPTLWSAGLKIWCSGGEKNPSTHFGFAPKPATDAPSNMHQIWILHAKENTCGVHAAVDYTYLVWSVPLNHWQEYTVPPVE